jgi:hypothetical protein
MAIFTLPCWCQPASIPSMPLSILSDGRPGLWGSFNIQPTHVHLFRPSCDRRRQKRKFSGCKTVAYCSRGCQEDWNAAQIRMCCYIRLQTWSIIEIQSLLPSPVPNRDCRRETWPGQNGTTHDLVASQETLLRSLVWKRRQHARQKLTVPRILFAIYAWAFQKFFREGKL